MTQKHSKNRTSRKLPLKVEELTQLLESVSKKFPETSKEYQAIELAAKALLYVYQEESRQKFAAFLAAFDADLSEEQKSRLMAMGIEV